MVAEGRVRVVGRARSIEVHATVELEPDVFRRSVGAGHDAEVAAFHHRDGGLVSIIRRVGDAGGITAIRKVVRVETFVTVRAVLARHRDARNLLDLAVARVGLV